MLYVHGFSQKKDTDATVNGLKGTCNSEDIHGLTLV